MSRIVLTCAFLAAIVASASAQTDPFPHPMLLDTAGDLVDVAAGDVNGDGLADVVTPSMDTGEVVVWLASPGGAFTPTTYPAVATARVVLLDDFDGDGNRDIVVGGTRVRFLAGDGAGGFSPPITIGPTQQNYRLLVARDFDGDGIQDVLALGHLAIVLVTGGPTTFIESPVANGIFLSAAAGDFDDDGDVDVVTNRASPGFVSIIHEVREGDGVGGFLPAAPFAMTPAAHHAVAGDLDGDGIDDVVLTGATAIEVFLGSAGGLITGSSRSPLIRFIGPPLLSDADQDGDLDLISKSGSGIQTVSIYPGGGDGTVGDPLVSVTSIRPASGPDDAIQLALDDLDGDGTVDLAVSDGDVEILPGHGNGEFGPVRTGFVPDLGIFDGVAADFDADGNLDLAVAGASNSTPGAAVCFGDGRGGLGTAMLLPQVVPFPGDVVSGDFDGDGLPDVAIAEGTHAGPAFHVFLSDGLGGFSQAPPVQSGRATDLDVGDFDDDGLCDVVAVIGDSSPTLFRSLGGGSFAGGSPAGLPFGTRGLAATHVDDDGSLDLVGVRYQFVDVVRGRGDGSFSAPSSLPVGDRFVLNPLIADLDLDGCADIVVHDGQPSGGPGTDGELVVFLGRTDGGFDPFVAVPAPLGSRAALTDLDGDGDREFCFVRHEGTSLAGFTSPATSVEFATTSLGVSFQVPGDFDGDGADDLLVDAFNGLLLVLPSSPTTERRGTGENLILESALGPGPATTFPVEIGRSLDPVLLVVRSPRGDFVGETVELALQLFATGDEPAALPGLPSIYLDFTTPIPPITALSAPLPAGGLTLAGAIPPGAAGISIFAQAFATTTAAANGGYAATDLHELRLVARPAPSITSIMPVHAAPGDPVTVTGRNFHPSATLDIDGVPVPVDSVGVDVISFTAPPGVACDAAVVVTNGDGQSAVRMWNPAPIITAINPVTVEIGDFVTITGSFGIPGTNTVTVDGAPVALVADSQSQLVFTAPTHAPGLVMVRVTVPTGCHDEIALTYTTLPPIITTITPPFTTPGGSVNVLGSSFDPGAAITVGGIPVTSSIITPNFISFSAPASAPCDTTITITNPDGLSASEPWNPSPVITTVVPAGVDTLLGGEITVTGQFADSDVFDVGGVPLIATSIGITTAVLTVPPGAPGPTTLTVTRISGCADSAPFAYLIDPPAIQNVVPDLAPTGATVTIDGLRFQPGLALQVGATPIFPATVTATRITFVVPPGVQCGPDVRITNPDGVSTSAPFNVPPTILAASPSSGPAAGGDFVFISGSGYLPGSTVLFGQTPAQILVLTNSLIIARSPGGSPGEVGVRVVNPIGCIEDTPYQYLP